MKRIVFLLKNKYPDEDCVEFSDYIKEYGVSTEFADPEDADRILSDMDETLLCTDDVKVREAAVASGSDAVICIARESEADNYPGATYFVMDPLDTEFTYYDRVYRRICDIPWEMVETERLILRETVESDVDAFYRIYSDSRMTEFMEPLYGSPEQEKKYVRDYRDKVYAVQGFGIWTIIRKQDGAIIGRAGLTARSGFDDIETGFAVGYDYNNRGYATEAVRGVLEFAKEAGFERVNALVMPGNEASYRVLGKCGFTFEREVSVEGVNYRLYFIKLQ